MMTQALGYPPEQDPSLHPFRSRTCGALCYTLAFACFMNLIINGILYNTKILDQYFKQYESLLNLSGFFALLGLFGFLILGSRLTAPLAADVLRKDPRPPIIYLRPFQFDNFFRLAYGPEFRILRLFRRVGPLVAIGRPKEKLQTSGISRYYVRDDEWQDLVLCLLPRSRAIILVLGESAGIEWELEKLLGSDHVDRLLIVAIAPGGSSPDSVRERLIRFFPTLPADLSPKFRTVRDVDHSSGADGIGQVALAMIDGEKTLRFLEPVIIEENGQSNGRYPLLNWRDTMLPFLDRVLDSPLRPQGWFSKLIWTLSARDHG
ncbi:hypothetical protein [Paludisphaera borealis]|nr:hypothetical protein [Paludisphaera borealis]